MAGEADEDNAGGVTVHVDTPAPAEPTLEGANGTLAGQAIHDAARAEVISERAEETAAEALATSERIEEQCQTLLSITETQATELVTLREALEQSQAQNLDLLRQIQSNTEQNSGSPTDLENLTPEAIAETAEIIETPEPENMSETGMEPSSETKTEAPEGNGDENQEHGEPITQVVQRRVLLY